MKKEKIESLLFRFTKGKILKDTKISPDNLKDILKNI